MRLCQKTWIPVKFSTNYCRRHFIQVQLQSESLRLYYLKVKLITDGVLPGGHKCERDRNKMVRSNSWNLRNRTKQEKHSGKGIAITFATALFFDFSVKSFARKVVQKFWGEVSVLSLPLRACESRSQCVSFTPLWAPLKLSLFHSIVFHMLLKLFISFIYTIEYRMQTNTILNRRKKSFDIFIVLPW